MSLRVRALAAADIEAAYDWYAERSFGLGLEFIRAVDASLAAIDGQPLLYPVVHRDIRRCLLRRFPYAVYYVTVETELAVIAVTHVRRHPRRWQSRAD